MGLPHFASSYVQSIEVLDSFTKERSTAPGAVKMNLELDIGGRRGIQIIMHLGVVARALFREWGHGLSVEAA
jgi:hypothetical protein